MKLTASELATLLLLHDSPLMPVMHRWRSLYLRKDRAGEEPGTGVPKQCTACFNCEPTSSARQFLSAHSLDKVLPLLTRRIDSGEGCCNGSQQFFHAPHRMKDARREVFVTVAIPGLKMVVNRDRPRLADE
jgi:hypothetical protein